MHKIRIEQHLICVGFRKREKYCIKEVDECYDYSWRSSTSCAMRKAQYTPYPKIQPKTGSRAWQFQGLDNLLTRLSQPCHNHATTLFQPCHNVVDTWYKDGCTTLWQGCHNLVVSIWEAARKVIGASQVIFKARTDKHGYHQWMCSTLNILQSINRCHSLPYLITKCVDSVKTQLLGWLAFFWKQCEISYSTQYQPVEKNMLHHVH